MARREISDISVIHTVTETKKGHRRDTRTMFSPDDGCGIRNRPDPVNSRRIIMKAWIARLAATIAVAGVLTGCAGLGHPGMSDLPVYETSLSE
jgi:hypothetical protein